MYDIREVDVYQLKDIIDKKDNFILIDVREKFEVEICKLEQFIHIPMNKIPDEISKISKKENIIIMCKSGVRSAQVCHFLNDRGYLNVSNLKGGIINWAMEIDSNMDIY